MKKEIIYSFQGLYRGDFRVTGFRFGEGEQSIAIVGGLRGNENQQIYCCSQLVRRLKELEEKGKICEGKEILVIPCGNIYSLNTKKRFWCIDNTDINRMFPGYDLGETTQRVADGIFKNIKDYRFGIQFSSSYMKGCYIPHVRMMKTGYENVELARQFGLPYVMVRETRPFDTTTLNYNWQIWETDAFSVYTSDTEEINKKSATQAVEAILNFMSLQGIIQYKGQRGYISEVISDEDLVGVRTTSAGIIDSLVEVGDSVCAGDVLAEIIDPYEGDVISQVTAPVDGTVIFAYNESMTYSNSLAFKLIRRIEL